MGRWLLRWAHQYNVTEADQLFTQLGYTGPPELFTMWSCLLLDKTVLSLPLGYVQQRLSEIEGAARV